MPGSSPSRPLTSLGQTLLTVAAGVAFVAAVAVIGATQPAVGDSPGAFARGGPHDAADVNPEAAEQGEQAEEKNGAFEEAQEKGIAGQSRPTGAAAAAPVAGWAGEQPVDNLVGGPGGRAVRLSAASGARQRSAGTRSRGCRPRR